MNNSLPEYCFDVYQACNRTKLIETTTHLWILDLCFYPLNQQCSNTEEIGETFNETI